DPDVLYPVSFMAALDNDAIQADVLRSFLSNQKDEPKQGLQRQYTARLDDLLEGTEKPQPAPAGRRFSLYGDTAYDPSKVMQGTNRFVFYSANLGAVKSPSLKQLLLTRGEMPVADLLLKTSGWWIDVFAATNEEMRTLSQHYMFISFRSFNHDLHSTEYLDAVNFYIIVFKTGVLTFHFQPLPHPHNVRRRIHQLKDFIHVTPEWIIYALIDDITDSFAPLIQHTELEVDSIDDLVLVLSVSEQTDMIRRIGSCRKTVMQLLRLLGPKADVVRSLIKRFGDKTHFYDDTKDTRKSQHEVTLYLGDIQDHLLTMLQNVNHYDLVLGRAHRNYLGQISIELSQAGNTTNEMINRLTFFATIVVPLNLVAGLFGMNVNVPGQYNTDLVWFYWILLGMFVYVVAMVAFGKRAGMI
ncbi:hypothetical protein BX666DRAFT_1838719, partial [Dichotomocladium elegans]